ncbi:MAG: hypothetical protein CEE38_14805 [Planctomycetes bacterium B3_Pla]|nr:MAG: hypothetical protein CEE38_14805 [Planctomycetes bacterium B3_Pla]
MIVASQNKLNVDLPYTTISMPGYPGSQVLGFFFNKISYPAKNSIIPATWTPKKIPDVGFMLYPFGGKWNWL